MLKHWEPVQSAWAAGDGKIHTQRGHRLLRCALQVVRGPAYWHEQFGLFHISLTEDGGLYFHHEKFVRTSYKGAKNQPLLRGGSRPQPLKSKNTRALWNMLLPSCSGHARPHLHWACSGHLLNTRVIWGDQWASCVQRIGMGKKHLKAPQALL